MRGSQVSDWINLFMIAILENIFTFFTQFNVKMVCQMDLMHWMVFERNKIKLFFENESLEIKKTFKVFLNFHLRMKKVSISVKKPTFKNGILAMFQHHIFCFILSRPTSNESYHLFILSAPRADTFIEYFLIYKLGTCGNLKKKVQH